jgi:hypothetical protein
VGYSAHSVSAYDLQLARVDLEDSLPTSAIGHKTVNTLSTGMTGNDTYMVEAYKPFAHKCKTT